jgi:transcriptional regulator with XRE-family HTH domain
MYSKGGFLMDLGEKLLYLRKKKGLSQEQLAAQVTVSRQAVSKWELGEAIPDTENVIQLTKIFEVSADFLLNNEIDIPVVSAIEKETAADSKLAMLKDTLTDDEYKLAKKVFKDRQEGNKKTQWWFLIAIFIEALIVIYFIFLS